MPGEVCSVHSRPIRGRIPRLASQPKSPRQRKRQRSERRGAKNAAIVGLLGAVSTVLVAVLGVIDIPIWTLAAGAALATGSAAALAYSLTSPPSHRVHSRWLAASLAGIALGGAIVFVASRPSDDSREVLEFIVEGGEAEIYRLRSEPGGADSLGGTVLSGGTRYWFDCEVLFHGELWMRDISGQWIPRTLLRWPNGSEPREIPRCE